MDMARLKADIYRRFNNVVRFDTQEIERPELTVVPRSKRTRGRRRPRGVPVPGTRSTYERDGRLRERYLHPTKGWRDRPVVLPA